MKKLLVANWKMNKNMRECSEFANEFLMRFSHQREAWIAPQTLHIPLLSHLFSKSPVNIGAQNISEFNEGAYTGETSSKSLIDAGGSFVILGHSERRQYFGETSTKLNAKIKNALSQKLSVIYCVGETLAERESKQTLAIVADQLHQGLNDQNLADAQNLIIAYEPIWAIGTGKTASPTEAQEVHAFIREVLSKKFPHSGHEMRILYGGSVKPDNVEELLSQQDIDGALVGGASLKAKDFLTLCFDK
jgi:triosephosphate isomerase